MTLRDGSSGAAALDSPAAERNKAPILEQLGARLPAQGSVLEVASGTGQHVAYFAAHLPQLQFVPSEPDPRLRAVISARLAASACANVAEPIDLDVTAPEWPVSRADALICANLIHIAPWAAAQGLVHGARRVLPPGAPLVLYGPFRRAGAHTAESNEAFDASLRARDPAWGVRDVEAVTELAGANGLELDEIVPMPANNFVVVYRRR